MTTSIKAAYSESAEVECFREMSDLDFDELAKSEEGFFCFLFNEERNEYCILGSGYEDPFPVQPKENSEADDKEQHASEVLKVTVSDGEKEREICLARATDEDLFVINSLFRALSCSRFLPLLRGATIRRVDSFPKSLNEYKTKKFFIVQDASCAKAAQSYRTTNSKGAVYSTKRKRNLQKRIKSFAGMHDSDSKNITVSSKPLILVSESEIRFGLD